MSESLPLTDCAPAVAHQRLSAARQRLLAGAANRIPLASVASQARALGLWDGKRAVPGDEAQFALLMDLGVFEPVGDHSPAIDRIARAVSPAPGSDEAVMLAALVSARFGLWRVIGPHGEGGARLLPMAAAPRKNLQENLLENLREDPGEDRVEIRVMDTGLVQATPGSGIALRLAFPEGLGFALSCGAIAPCDTRVLQRLLLDLAPERGAPVLPSLPAPGDGAVLDRLLAQHATRARLAALLQGKGLAARAYRAAIDLGLMGPVPGRTPEQPVGG